MSSTPPTAPLRWAGSLWTRIATAVLVGYLAATLVAGVFLGMRLRALDHASRLRRLTETGELLEPAVRRALVAGDHGISAGVCRAAGELGDLRITVILPDGEVVAESERPLPLGNHADRPEVREALAAGAGRSVRDSTTIGEAFLYVARRIDGDDGRPLGVLRLATPVAAREQSVDQLQMLLLIALGVGIPVAVAVAYVASRRIARPLEDMTEAASRMAAGDFGRLPRAISGDEAGRLAAALRRMGTELSTMLQTSESDRAELSAILESMVEGVIALDAAQRVIRANRGAAAVLDLDDVPRPGQPLGEIVRLPALTELVRRVLRGEHVKDADVSFPGLTGRVVNLSASPILGAADAIAGAVLVLRDVTSLRRLERARLDFVANVSHELRTPVAAVLGALETVQDLRDDESPDARRRLVETAHRNAGRLSSIVNDLLALSAIETEEGSLERAPVPLLRTIRSAAGALGTESERRGVRIVLPAPDAPDVVVDGHEGRLELVWVNLLGNALKYTPEGGSATVGVRVHPGRRMACVSVSDTGTGIPAEALQRIFERFYRVDKARSRDRGGTGLGLAIVKHIVRAHRGRVEVESEVGVGSTFRVWLPLFEPAREAAEPNG